MEGNLDGIRVVPPIIEFFDIEASTPYEATVKIINSYKNTKVLRLNPPLTKNFKLAVKNPSKPIAPGIGFTAKIKFCAEKVKDYNDYITLFVDSEDLKIPLFAYSPTSKLDIDGPVDFGLVISNNHFLSKEVTLMNRGSKKAEFQITYDGNKQIQISPQNGLVYPEKSFKIEVKLFTGAPGFINEFANVEFEGTDQLRLQIQANIVEQSLRVLQFDDFNKDQKCINFGPVYYETDRIEPAWVYNESPETVKWVAVLEENCDGEEAGIDFTLTTASIVATTSETCARAYDVLTSLVTVFPKQGLLQPYEKTPIYFRFSPRTNLSDIGWHARQVNPPRQDFALFICFQIIGSIDSLNSAKKKFEVGVRGTALPVLANFQPKRSFDFGKLVCGKRISMQCTITNESTALPLDLKVKRIAQFHVTPKRAFIKPKTTKEFTILFQPNQAGTFKKIQLFEIFGRVLKDEDQTESCFYYEPFHTIPIQLMGSSTFQDSCIMKKIERKNSTEFRNNGAIIAKIDDRPTSIRPANRKFKFETKILGMARYNYIDTDYTYTKEEEIKKVANDNRYIAMLKTQRSERLLKKGNRENLKFDNSVDIGIIPAKGLIPLKIKSSEIKVEFERLNTKPHIAEANRLLTSQNCCKKKKEIGAQPISDGLNAVAVTEQEKLDCSRILSPEDLYNIVIGPPVLDFGEVCTRSTTRRSLSVVNKLNQYIHFEIMIKFKELRGTSPLTQVLPPNSVVNFNIVFESTVEGKFNRSLKYSINSQHTNDILVKATVLPVALRLSTNHLEITSDSVRSNHPADRSTVTLFNDQNYPAQFSWSPILGERGTAFSIRPASGIVNAFKSLNCEVVFHQNYFAPLQGEFQLNCLEGNSLKLSCSVLLGSTLVKFQERRVNFGSIPLNLISERHVLLMNSGPNNAMFYIVDTTPIPNMTISPQHGVIPMGGSTKLNVMLSPKTAGKFETLLQVNIRGWRTIEVRINGVVDTPRVDTDVVDFKFHGVYCGSWQHAPFKLINNSPTRAFVQLDLSSYEDFYFTCDQDTSDEDQYKDDKKSGRVPQISLPSHSSVSCQLTFRPKSVAGYDFFLPISINNILASTPESSSHDLTQSSECQRMLIGPASLRRRIQATALRPPLIVSQTEFKFSLPVSYMEMSIPDNAGGDRKVLTLTNQSDSDVEWRLALSSVKGLLSKDTAFIFLKPGGADFAHNKVNGTLKPGETYNVTVVFCPRTVGSYICNIPLIINDERNRPYRMILLDASMIQSKIRFEPPILSINPLPLHTEVSRSFKIIATNYFKPMTLEMRMENFLEYKDVDLKGCIQVEFPDGLQMFPEERETNELDAIVTFKSSNPISVGVNIIFTDVHMKQFILPVTATAENCLLTAYPFLAAHRNDYRIVCDHEQTQTDDDNNRVLPGEAILIPVESAQDPCYTRSSRESSIPSSKYASSLFDRTTTTPNSEYDRNQTRNTSMIFRELSEGTSMKSESTMTCSSVSIDVIDDKKKRITKFNKDLNIDDEYVKKVESTVDKEFSNDILKALQNWYALYGWPGGVFSFEIPEDIRTLVSRFPFEYSSKDRRFNNSASRTNLKTLYDMISYLCGRYVPGIPSNQILPTDTYERLAQIHWQHSTLLTFLRAQGASVSGIEPEYLMTPSDYRSWIQMLKNIETPKLLPAHSASDATTTSSATSYSSLDLVKLSSKMTIQENVFEVISRQAWSDLLLQIYKVFVLARVSHEHYKMMKPIKDHKPFPPVNPDPLSSNIYSTSERIILSWLNHNYESHRKVIWREEDDAVDLPTARWVVNFDLDLLDGLVVAASIAAYCPWLIKDFFWDMYTSPKTPEQCLHNSLVVVKAMRSIGMNYKIDATDITDPNPISMLFFCVYLYRQLPEYLPKAKIEFSGSLGVMISRKIYVQNPSAKWLKYRIYITGPDAVDFSIIDGYEINIPPRVSGKVEVYFKSRFLRPAEAYLTFVSRVENTLNEKINKRPFSLGSTLVFNLSAVVDNIEPVRVISASSPCYELTPVKLTIKNAFNEEGNFSIEVIEPKVEVRNTSTKKPVKSIPNKKNNRIVSLLSPDIKKRISQNDVRVQNEIEAFYCCRKSIWLKPNEEYNLMINYLPFNLGKDFCTIQLFNKEIGEMFYAVEGECLFPLPSPLKLNQNSPHCAIMDDVAKQSRGWNENILYWKCTQNMTLYETLFIPITNPSKERALRLATRQNMSLIENRRRSITGTFQSGNLAASIILKNQSNNSEGPFKTVFSKKTPKTFNIRSSSNWFTLTDKVLVPPLDYQSVKSDSEQFDGTFAVDLKFNPTNPGHYPCEIIVNSESDVRVYQIECIVNSGGTNAKFEFNAPANESLTQNIPIQNASNHDWYMDCKIEAKDFFGPDVMKIKAMTTALYPLTFKPHAECYVEGTLTICNKVDGFQHNFQLCGTGETSLAIDHIKLKCKCRSSTEKVISVPNLSKLTMKYSVYSDIPTLNGRNQLIVPKGLSADYPFTVTGYHRGVIKGVLMFVCDDLDIAAHEEPDSDSDSNSQNQDQKGLVECNHDVIRPDTPNFLKTDDLSNQKKDGHKIWFSIEVEVAPSDPCGTIEIECEVQQQYVHKVFIPSTQETLFNVVILGEDLTSQKSLKLMPGVPGSLPIIYSPLKIGSIEGSVVLDSEATGEFWYKVIAKALPPAPVSLPTINCRLGSITRQAIPVKNMLNEEMLINIYISNTNCFSFDLPFNVETNQQYIRVQPNSSVDLMLQFSACTLGLANHNSTVILTSKQLGEMIYYTNGRGLTPLLMDPLNASAGIGSSTSLVLPFKSPFEVPVLIDIKLNNNEFVLKNLSASVISQNVTLKKAFIILQKQTTGLLLNPRASLDVSLAFMPSMMIKYESILSLDVRRKDGSCWPKEFEEDDKITTIPSFHNEDLNGMKPLSRNNKGEITSIRWMYPLHGIPTIKSTKPGEAVLQCQARSRIEEELEVTLAGAVPDMYSRQKPSLVRLVGSMSSSLKTRAASVTPLKKKQQPEVIEGLTLNEEYHFDFFYQSHDAKIDVEQYLSAELIRKDQDPHNGFVILAFKLIFAPFRTLNHTIQLNVLSASGSSWSFPLTIKATEPPPDDFISIEATNLKKSSTVSIKLFSKSKHATPFQASFCPDTGHDFTVSPQTGELLPHGTPGTRLEITFTPQNYGRKHVALLTVKTLDMQWSYEVKGITSTYKPPVTSSKVVTRFPASIKQPAREPPNFLRKNLKLLSTASSSPIKGKPIMSGF